jgi:hypothetical protein
MSQLVTQLRAAGCSVEWPSGSSQIAVNDELTIAVVVVSARPSCGKNQWQVRRSSWSKPDIIVLARVNDGETSAREYYLIPSLFLTNFSWLTFSEKRLKSAESFKSATIDPLIRLCAREQMGGANAARP